MIEVVQIAPLFISRLEGIDLPVSGIEGRRESPKQLRHGKVSFRVADIHSRIDQPRLSVISRDEIA